MYTLAVFVRGIPQWSRVNIALVQTKCWRSRAQTEVHSYQQKFSFAIRELIVLYFRVLGTAAVLIASSCNILKVKAPMYYSVEDFSINLGGVCVQAYYIPKTRITFLYVALL